MIFHTSICILDRVCGDKEIKREKKCAHFLHEIMVKSKRLKLSLTLVHICLMERNLFLSFRCR